MEAASFLYAAPDLSQRELVVSVITIATAISLMFQNVPTESHSAHPQLGACSLEVFSGNLVLSCSFSARQPVHHQLGVVQVHTFLVFISNEPS